MRKKSFIFVIAAALMVSMLTGCGSVSKYEMTADSAASAEPAAAPAAVEAGGSLYDNGAEIYEEEAVTEEAPAEEFIEEPEGSTEAPEVQDPLANRKLITTMDVSAETEHFDELMAELEQDIVRLGGYIESSEQWNGSYNYYGERAGNRNSYLTIRIPADKLDGFIAVMEEKSNIVSKSRRVEDVTLAYVDLESHKKALETEQERLLELMEMAETVEDLIALEERLSDVRYNLESMESQLRTYDNRINYSTVHLDISEVQRLTPEAELTTWGRIRSGFAENVYNVGVEIRDFFVNLIISIPYIIVWLVILAVVLVIVFLLARREKKRKAKRLLKKQMAQTTIAGPDEKAESGKAEGEKAEGEKAEGEKAEGEKAEAENAEGAKEKE